MLHNKRDSMIKLRADNYGDGFVTYIHVEVKVINDQ